MNYDKLHRQAVFARFQANIKDHTLTIVKNDGVFRHMVCKKPEGSSYAFQITTTPGYLMVTGSMGSWVFSRTHDMLDFFRADRGEINPGYWQEKIQSAPKCSPGASYDRIQTLSLDQFKRALWMEALNFTRHMKSQGVNAIDRRDKIEELKNLKEDAVCMEDYNYALHELNAFDWDDYPFSITEFAEQPLFEYSDQYLWICYAIAWSIDQYDRSVALSAPKTEAV